MEYFKVFVLPLTFPYVTHNICRQNASGHWILDSSPPFESYIGFLEPYSDPYGVRAEWEGFVCLTSREESKKYSKLVEKAEELVASLPWGKNFEREIFKRPEFTATEVLGFAAGGVPGGMSKQCRFFG